MSVPTNPGAGTAQLAGGKSEGRSTDPVRPRASKQACHHLSIILSHSSSAGLVLMAGEQSLHVPACAWPDSHGPREESRTCRGQEPSQRRPAQEWSWWPACERHRRCRPVETQRQEATRRPQRQHQQLPRSASQQRSPGSALEPQETQAQLETALTRCGGRQAWARAELPTFLDPRAIIHQEGCWHPPQDSHEDWDRATLNTCHARAG